ncbi:uncharacterized protein LOC135368562 [Ornithodoros turicata]|uniref:uncharacterized protein LOC135368562 n=1 Tax=Ornithodoros turicata TaxID=34597 RepID=UPI003138C87C
MATWSISEWSHDSEEVEVQTEPEFLDNVNSAVMCDLSVQVKLARSNYTGSSRLAPFMEMTPVKSPMTMEEELYGSGRPENLSSSPFMRSSDVDLPKQTIVADPLDLSVSENEFEHEEANSQPLETIPEDPEMEDRLGMEQDLEQPEESSSHMEDEPVPLPPAEDAQLDELDDVLSMEQVADVEAPSPLMEPEVEVSNQEAVESALPMEGFDFEKDAAKDLSDKRTSTEGLANEEVKHTPPVPEMRTSVSSMIPPVVRRSGARKKTTATSEFVAPLVQARAPWAADLPRRNRAALFLERQHMAEGGYEVHAAHVAVPHPQDLMSLEGVAKGGDEYKKEEFGELFSKHTQSDILDEVTTPLVTKASRVPCVNSVEDADEDVVFDFDHLPIRQRMDIWKKREHKAIRQGLILIPKLSKQGRFPISARI